MSSYGWEHVQFTTLRTIGEYRLLVPGGCELRIELELEYEWLCLLV
jgi:hypothetical protein